MWKRISGKSDKANDQPAQSKSRRSHGGEKHTTPQRSGSVISTDSKITPSSHCSDDRDRGFNPRSTSYSSTSRAPYEGVAGPSVASSYATATGNGDDESYEPPGLVRNGSLVDKMPNSRSSRDEVYSVPGDGILEDDRRSERRRNCSTSRDGKSRRRERSRSLERKEKGDKKERRDKKDKTRRDTEPMKSSDGARRGEEPDRGPAEFSNQMGSAGLMQIPGQYGAVIPEPSGIPAENLESVSSHVQDQFPGQFPTESSAPYRPPLASGESGPGLAAEYYGDAGESVAHQPGYRKHSPSLIIGAEPHLLPASSIAAPPPEPSASGVVGAAASFFSGDFDEGASTTNQQDSVHTSATGRPESSYHTSSAPIIPPTSTAALGAAAGYMMSGGNSAGSSSSFHQQRPNQATSLIGAHSEHSISTTQDPPSQTQAPNYSSSARPPKLGKTSFHSSNIPLHAVGAVGAAALAGASYSHAQHSSAQPAPTAQQYPTTPMKRRHRHHGPLGAVVDFFKDPDGVAQFEEYSEIIGVCRGCFEPGSSPRDAPRNHRFYKRRSKERLGSKIRVDKQNRYTSSDDEDRRNKESSWLGAGLAGYGLGKVGQALFNQKNDFDDTYDVKSGRFSPNIRNPASKKSPKKSRRRSHSSERIDIGITRDGKVYRKHSYGQSYEPPATTFHTAHPHSISRQSSRDRSSNLADAKFDAALGSSAASSNVPRRSQSPMITLKDKQQSPDRRRKGRRNKKEKGFFSFLSPSSSSSNLESTSRSDKEKRRKARGSNDKIRNDCEAGAVLLGLGAATAALALQDGPSSKKSKKEFVAVKETKGKRQRRSKESKHSSTSSEEVWESASEGEFSHIDSDLAFGSPSRRSSRESLSSQTSGTDKWDWRWGSVNKRNGSSKKASESSSFPTAANTGGVALGRVAMGSADQYHRSAMDSTSSLPLQHVYPVPTSDPGRFDVQREGSNASYSHPMIVSRPEAVPIQQPRPIAPVSSSFYTSEGPSHRSYSAPTRPPAISQPPFSKDAPMSSISGPTPDSDERIRERPENAKLRRRGTSPARFGEDIASNSMAPQHRPSAKDDFSTIRFALSEEQGGKDRKEQHRGRKNEKEGDERRESQLRDLDDKPSERRESAGKHVGTGEQTAGATYIAPAVGIAGVAMGAAMIAEESGKDETREERRERRRRERAREDEEDTTRKEERRRRKEREHQQEMGAVRLLEETEDDVTAGRRNVAPDDVSPSRKMSLQEEAGARHYTYEDYQSFFAPIEILDKSDGQVKITGAEPDADVDMDRNAAIVEIAPKGAARPPDEPEWSVADTNENIDLSKTSLPWAVPHLKLVQPTPPASRALTPLLELTEISQEDDQEVTKKRSPSKVTWGDDQTHEYTAIPPIDHQEEFIDAPPKATAHHRRTRDYSDSESDGRDEPRSDQDHGTCLNRNPFTNASSYGDDYEFAATLAASAQDAGFDPSIVIDDPSYRRRDSPPGSNDRSVPGGLNEDDELVLSRKDKKKRDRAHKRHDEADMTEERDDNAIVEDIVSQVEQSKPLNGAEDTPDYSDYQRGKKSRKSKRSSEYSKSTANDVEASEATSEERTLHDIQPEQTTSCVVSGPADETGSHGKSRKKSKRRSSGFDDAASTTSSAANAKGSKETNPKAGMGNLWNQVPRDSADDLPQSNETKGAPQEAMLNGAEEPKKRSKKAKDYRSNTDIEDENASTTSGTSKFRDKQTRRGSHEDGDDSVAGRITQDLPAKEHESALAGDAVPAGSVTRYLDNNDSETEIALNQKSESFLGMRPEPPPSPDIYDHHKEPSGLLKDEVLRSLQQDQHRPSNIPTSNLQYSARGLPSPTAVPFHFRRPRPAPGFPRSASQSALSSDHIHSEVHPRQKPRPRSIEFVSSKEIRPLWLVERHQSHQEPSPDETYPPLPESHSTSAASSTQDPEEYYGKCEHEHEMVERNYNQQNLLIDIDRAAPQSDLLDSQQATPTANSFAGQVNHRETTASPTSRSTSLPNTKDTRIDLLIGGSAANALEKANDSIEQTRVDLPEDEAVQLRRADDEMALPAELLTPVGEMERPLENEPVADFQKVKKDKESKRKGGQHLAHADRTTTVEEKGVSIESDDLAIQLEGPIEASGEGQSTEDMAHDKTIQSTMLAAENRDVLSQSTSTSGGGDFIGSLERLKSNLEEKTDQQSQMYNEPEQDDRHDQTAIQSKMDVLADPLPVNDNLKNTKRIQAIEATTDVDLSATIEARELLPCATPLPDDNDLDLLDPPPTDLPDEDHELIASDTLEIEKASYPPSIAALQGPEDTPTQAASTPPAEQEAADGYFAFGIEERTKKTMKGNKGNITKQVPEIESGSISNDSSVLEAPPSRVEEVDSSGHAVSQDKPNNIKDEWAVPGGKKEGKKGKKQRSSADDFQGANNKPLALVDATQMRKDDNEGGRDILKANSADAEPVASKAAEREQTPVATVDTAAAVSAMLAEGTVQLPSNDLDNESAPKQRVNQANVDEKLPDDYDNGFLTIQKKKGEKSKKGLPFSIDNPAEEAESEELTTVKFRDDTTANPISEAHPHVRLIHGQALENASNSQDATEQPISATRDIQPANIESVVNQEELDTVPAEGHSLSATRDIKPIDYEDVLHQEEHDLATATEGPSLATQNASPVDLANIVPQEEIDLVPAVEYSISATQNIDPIDHKDNNVHQEELDPVSTMEDSISATHIDDPVDLQNFVHQEELDPVPAMDENLAEASPEQLIKGTPIIDDRTKAERESKFHDETEEQGVAFASSKSKKDKEKAQKAKAVASNPEDFSTVGDKPLFLAETIAAASIASDPTAPDIPELSNTARSENTGEVDAVAIKDDFAPSKSKKEKKKKKKKKSRTFDSKTDDEELPPDVLKHISESAPVETSVTPDPCKARSEDLSGVVTSEDSRDVDPLSEFAIPKGKKDKRKARTSKAFKFEQNNSTPPQDEIERSHESPPVELSPTTAPGGTSSLDPLTTVNAEANVEIKPAEELALPTSKQKDEEPRDHESLLRDYQSAPSQELSPTEKVEDSNVDSEIPVELVQPGPYNDSGLGEERVDPDVPEDLEILKNPVDPDLPHNDLQRAEERVDPDVPEDLEMLKKPVDLDLPHVDLQRAEERVDPDLPHEDSQVVEERAEPDPDKADQAHEILGDMQSTKDKLQESKIDGGAESASTDINSMPEDEVVAVSHAQSTRGLGPSAVDDAESRDQNLVSQDQSELNDMSRNVLPAEKDFSLPKNTKDKKRAKKVKAHDKGTTTPEVEEMTVAAGTVPEPSAAVSALGTPIEPQEVVEQRPNNKKNKKAEQGRALIWDGEDSIALPDGVARETHIANDAPLAVQAEIDAEDSKVFEPQEMPDLNQDKPSPMSASRKALDAPSVIPTVQAEKITVDLAEFEPQDMLVGKQDRPFLLRDIPVEEAPEQLDELTTKQPIADDNVGVVQNIESETSPSYNLKKSKKDKKKAKKAKALGLDEEDTVGKPSTNIYAETGLAEPKNDDEPHHVDLEPILAGNESIIEVSCQEKFDDEVVPTEVDGPQGESLGEKPAYNSQVDSYAHMPGGFGVDDLDFKDNNPVTEIGQEAFDAGGMIDVHEGTTKHIQTPEAVHETVVEDVTTSQSKDQSKGIDVSWEVPVKKSKKDKKKSKNVKITSEAPEIIAEPPVEVFEPSEVPPIDTPLSGGSVDLLDAEEQREYHEEYARELERQLSGDADRNLLDQQVYEPSVPESEAHDSTAPPSRERPENLTKQTSEHDIAEELGSNSGSLQEPSAIREDDFASFKPTKSKKGKKSKKQQPIIWEDDTATEGIVNETGPFISEPEVSTKTRHVEKPAEQGNLHDEGAISAIRSSPSLRRAATGGQDESADYFGIQPLQRVEKDIGQIGDGDHRQSPSPEATALASNIDAAEPGISDGQAHDVADQQPLNEDSGPLTSKQRKNGDEHEKRDPQRDTDALTFDGQHPVQSSFSRTFDTEHPNDVLLPPRDDSPKEGSHGDDISATLERSESNDRSKALETAAAANPLSTATLATEQLSYKVSKKDKKKDKRRKKAGARTEEDKAQLETLGMPSEQHQTNQELDMIAQENFDNTMPQPALPAGLEEQSQKPSGVRTPSPTPIDRHNRDSAIYVSDSPTVPESEQMHRVGRDSGYPDIEASPLIKEEATSQDAERDIIEMYGTEPTRQSTLSEGDVIDFYRDDSRDGSVPSERRPEQIPQSRSPIREPLRVSTDIEAKDGVATAERKSKRTRSKRTSGGAYDSDDSADSGFDIQKRRRRLQALAEEQSEPSPVRSTTKDRSSVLFDSPPSVREMAREQPIEHLETSDQLMHGVLRDVDSQHTQVKPVPEQGWSFRNIEDDAREQRPSIFGSAIQDRDAIAHPISPVSDDNRGRRLMRTISERSAEHFPLSVTQQEGKDAPVDSSSPKHDVVTRMTSSKSSDSAGTMREITNTDDLRSPLSLRVNHEDEHAVDVKNPRGWNTDQVSSRQSIASIVSSIPPVQRDPQSPGIGSPDSISAIIRTPDQIRSASGQSFRSSGTPPLRRVDRSASGDLRGASQKSEAKIGAKLSEEAEPYSSVASSSTYDPLVDKGKNRADMADYEGWGDVRGHSPMSPTRPPSMRKRQSMQFAEMEQRLAMLASENGLLQSAKSKAEKRLEEQARDHSQQRQSYEDAVQDHKAYIAERDSTLNELNHILGGLRQQVAHLTEANEELIQSQGVRNAEDEHHVWERTSKELEDLRVQHSRLATDHEEIVLREVEAIREEKDIELQQLREELENAKDQVRKLQQQILASRSSDDIVEHDEDYFDAQCQELCKHLTSWVTRFSKLSDHKRCYLASEIQDASHRDLFEDSMLDGSEVDDYLQDRHKRRDVFMSVTMSLIFKHIFARYLFGMDREHRQKLKTLDKTLLEVGPPSAVHKWRATTLTLLSRRPAFHSQRNADSEAVVEDIWSTLSGVLPPPSTAQAIQCQESLRRIINLAVDLSIDMRLQRAEYSMLPPPEPDFDTNGDINNKLHFTAASMNERSGAGTSNEEIEEQGAYLRMVLFPLVVKSIDDEEQIVVCPAQVHVAPLKKGKTVRVVSAQGGRSEASYAGTEDVPMEGGMF